jgi:hypothetical protein
MKPDISYKDCLIRGEAFQREKNGTWVAQYTVTRQDTGSTGSGFPSHQYQFNEAFPSESEADEYALRRAREWIDKS